ncbi:MAG: hypothetical protein R3C03_02885 [Pirellulaceae bacterium]
MTLQPLNVRTIAFTCLFSGWLSIAVGQQFKLDSQVYVEGQPEPIANSLTLFDDGFVYDISLDPNDSTMIVEAVVYDSHAKSFDLIDMAQKRRVRIEQFELVRMVENLRQSGMKEPHLKELVDPQMVKDVDLASNEVSLHNAIIRYTAKCFKPDDSSILTTYYEFLDQCTRLSASDPRRLPPFARLELNQTLKQYSLLPQEISLKVSGGDFYDGDISLQSKHTLIMSLSDQDRSRIQHLKKAWVEYEKVTLAKYRNIERTASTDSISSEQSIR